MKDKKTETFRFRLTDEERVSLEEAAKFYGYNSSDFVRQIISRLVAAYKAPGVRLIWPLEFDYIPAGTQTAFEEQRNPKPQKISSSTEKKKAGERAA